MSFEPSARLVPSLIKNQNNYFEDYQNYERKKKAKGNSNKNQIKNLFMDTTNKYVNSLEKQKDQEKSKKQNQLKSIMKQQCQIPKILDLNYISQDLSQQEPLAQQQKQLEHQQRKENYQIQPIKRRKILFQANDQSSSQNQEQQQSLKLKNIAKENIFDVSDSCIKYQQQRQQLEPFQSTLKQKSQNLRNSEQNFKTHRAVLSKQDEIDAKNEMNHFEQQRIEQNQKSNKQNQIKQNKKSTKKKFILQFSQNQSSQQAAQSIHIDNNSDKNKHSDKQIIINNGQNIKILNNSNNKAFLLGQFKDSSQDQQQQSQDKNINSQIKQSFEIVKQLNYKAFQTGNIDYLFTSIPSGNILQCIIRRDKKTKLGVQYHIYDSCMFKHILTIKDSSSGGGYQFVKKVSPIKEQYIKIATVKSNFFGTEFNCFDQRQKCENKSNLISIVYHPNILGLKGPRKMEVYVPNQKILTKNSLKQLYSSDQIRVKKYINKFPRWNKQIGAYVLNFKGRATHSSIKNFIIVRQNQQKNLVLFGKVGSDVFNLDIKYPFSIVQAAAMTISSFDKKLACE